MSRKTYTFSLWNTLTATAFVDVHADSVEEAMAKFGTLDKRHVEWQLGDTSTLCHGATVGSIKSDDPEEDPVVLEWKADDSGQWG